MNERLIFFDTETAGVNKATDRICEVGLIETVGLVETGNVFHRYINPQQKMPAEAQEIHGLSDEFLADKPIFNEIALDLVDFIGGAKVVAHNASFDVEFILAELRRCGISTVPWSASVDTLLIARQRFPGSPASLNALLDRFNIDRSSRTLHGALLDSQLLIPVYFKLLGLDQLQLTTEKAEPEQRKIVAAAGALQSWFPRRGVIQPSPEEMEQHRAFIGKLGDEAVWKRWASTADQGLNA